MIAYVVPIREGRLNAKHWLGGKAKLSAIQSDFAETVGARFGLARGIEGGKARHQTVRQFYATITETAKAYAQRVKLEQAEKQSLQEALDTWTSAFDEGLTDEQAAQLFDLANRMRAANRVKAQLAPILPRQDDGQTMGM